MSMPSGISISNECLTAYNDLRLGKRGQKPKFVIYKISGDQRTVVVDETSTESDYEVFRQKVCSAVDGTSAPAPRYAVYGVAYDLGEDGKRWKPVFISWVPGGSSTKLCMLYASTKEPLRSALDVQLSVHADSPDEMEWKSLVSVASGGKVTV